MKQAKSIRYFLAAILLATGGNTLAADDLVFSAPPRETSNSGDDMYGPVAEYLSKALGRKVVYKHPGNWLSYQFDIQRDKYDIVFDGPHFVSWRMTAHQHEPLAKVPGKLQFYVVVREESKITELGQLGGRPICGLAPPNLATLTVQAEFPNVARQPSIVNAKGFKQAYQMMRAGVCQAAVLPKRTWTDLVEGKPGVRTIFQSAGVPNQAFTASKRLSSADKHKLAQALLGPEANTRMALFMKEYTKGKGFEKTASADYVGYAGLLKNVFGFELAWQSTHGNVVAARD